MGRLSTPPFDTLLLAEVQPVETFPVRQTSAFWPYARGVGPLFDAATLLSMGCAEKDLLLAEYRDAVVALAEATLALNSGHDVLPRPEVAQLAAAVEAARTKVEEGRVSYHLHLDQHKC